MTKAVLLDTNPLSQVIHPRIKPEVIKWLQSLQKTATVLRVPEIADYELRRELLRARKQKSIERLNQINQPPQSIPITTGVMRKAAELWAWVRNQGQATTSKDSLDGDVVLAAQAIFQLDKFDEVAIVTTNLKHISRFQCKGIEVLDWEQTLKELT
jgi:predicted nucleic acid-binding protein